MRKTVLLCLLLSGCTPLLAQHPKNGTYIYKVAFAEWDGHDLGCTVKVVIKGDSIYVYNNGKMTGPKYGLIESGIIMKHRRTGKYIIGHSRADKDAPALGGCTDGPSEIDFKRKRYWTC